MIFAVAFMIPLSGPIAISSYMQYRDRKRMEAGQELPPIKMKRPDTATIMKGPYFNKHLTTTNVGYPLNRASTKQAQALADAPSGPCDSPIVTQANVAALTTNTH